LLSSIVHSCVYVDLQRALGQAGCPVCTLRVEAAERLIDQLLYEKVNDRGLRARLRRARGFCPEHAAAFQRPGAALGVAILMRDVLGAIMEGGIEAAGANGSKRVGFGFRKWRGARRGAKRILQRLQPTGICPICAQLFHLERACYRVLWEEVQAQGPLFEAYAQSEGLCLPHIRGLLECAPNEVALHRFLEVQQALWRSLVRDLDAIIRRSDYRYLDEPWGQEAGAWVRALRMVCGASLDKETSGNRAGPDDGR